MKKVMTTLAVFALGASLAMAAPQQDQSGKWQGGEHHGHHGGMFGKMMAEKLNLTDAQKQQMKDINKSFRAQNEAFFAQAKQTRQEFHAAKQANDQAKLDALKPAIEAQRAQLKQLEQAKRQQFLTILTPEQRAQLDAMKAEWKAKREAKKTGQGQQQ